MKLPDITPGSWLVDGAHAGMDGIVSHDIVDGDGVGVAIVPIGAFRNRDPRREANAKAISAVPVMLEALGETRSLLRHGAAVSDEYREMVFDKVVAALRLAGAVE